MPPRFIRFVPPDQTNSYPWLLIEAGEPPNNWLLFIPTGKDGVRRRISPAPPSWRQFDQAKVGELWNRATLAPLPKPHSKVDVALSARPDGDLAEAHSMHEELLWGRSALEELMLEAERIAEELKADLDSAHAELSILNEEIQALTRMLDRTPPVRDRHTDQGASS